MKALLLLVACFIAMIIIARYFRSFKLFIAMIISILLGIAIGATCVKTNNSHKDTVNQITQNCLMQSSVASLTAMFEESQLADTGAVVAKTAGWVDSENERVFDSAPSEVYGEIRGQPFEYFDTS